MWVQLKSLKHIEKQGKLKTYQPGDWVDVGKQTALLWIAEGSAWVPEGQAANLLSADCGVIVLGDGDRAKKALGDYVGKIDIETLDPARLPQRLSWSKTLLYNPLLKLRKDLLPIGFHLLDTWQAAIPIWDYDKIASGQGDDDDRQRTRQVIHELRVPLYSPDLIFLRRCGDVDRFLKAWRDDDVGDRRFSLLRALYTSRPLLLALPTTWIGKDRGID